MTSNWLRRTSSRRRRAAGLVRWSRDGTCLSARSVSWQRAALIDLPGRAAPRSDTLEGAGKTLALVAVDGDAGRRAWRWPTRSRSARPQAIARLQEQGVAVWMITGDNARVAESIAAQAGVPSDHVLAEALPGEKAEQVRPFCRSRRMASWLPSPGMA